MKYKLIIDIKSVLPMLGSFQMDFSEYFGIIDRTGIVLWDSDYGGMEPKVVDVDFVEARLLDIGRLSTMEKDKLVKALKDGDYDCLKGYRNG